MKQHQHKSAGVKRHLVVWITARAHSAGLPSYTWCGSISGIIQVCKDHASEWTLWIPIVLTTGATVCSGERNGRGCGVCVHHEDSRE